MALENKLNITDSTELARIEEKISKKKAIELFENGYLDQYEAGTFKIEDYLLAMERSPILRWLNQWPAWDWHSR